MKTVLTKKIMTLGIASLLTLSTLTGCTSEKNTEIVTQQIDQEKIGQSVQLTSPTGPRKMVNFEGNRYVFLNDGEVFELTKEQLGDEITKQDEGTFYELEGFSPEFRMAFQYKGDYYICENVGKSDDSAMDVQAYLEVADLKSHVIYADIFDLYREHILNGLDKEAADEVLDIFNQAQIVELTQEEHEAIAKAQAEELGYLVEFTLEDYTTFKSYIIPTMNYITIGDYTCVVEDLETKVGTYFENLQIPEDIIMN